MPRRLRLFHVLPAVAPCAAVGLFFLATLCPLQSGAAKPADDANVREALQQSVVAERAGKVADAIDLLLKDSSSGAMSYTVNVRLGWLYYESAKYPEAEKYYQAAVELEPESIEAKQGFQLALLADAKYAEAESASRKLLELDPDNFYGNLRLAIALRQQSKYTQSAKILQQLLTAYASSLAVSDEFKELRRADAAIANRIPAAEFFDAPASSAWQKSLEAETAGNYADAAKALKDALKSRPKSYLFNSRLGWLTYANGDYHSSEAYYARAVKAAPQSIEAKLGYLAPLAALEQYSQLATIAGQVLRFDKKNYSANLWLAFADRKLHKPKLAEPILEHLLISYPTDVAAMNELGRDLATEDDKAPARERFAQVLALDPGNTVATAQLQQLQTP